MRVEPVLVGNGAPRWARFANQPYSYGGSSPLHYADPDGFTVVARCEVPKDAPKWVATLKKLQCGSAPGGVGLAARAVLVQGV